MTGKVRILVGGGDAAARVAMSDLLSAAGYEVVQAATPDEAVEGARRDRPDLVLLDATAGAPSYAACRAIKRVCQPPPAVLLASERQDKREVMEAIRAGGDDLLPKPLIRERVLDRVRAALGGARPSAALPPSTWDRRVAARAATNWTVSWAAPLAEAHGVTYKGRVIDISVTGLALEFQRCGTCTGYEQGNVHEQCLFRPYALKKTGTEDLDLILSLTPEIVLEVQGRIAHVFQPAEWPFTEKVGIAFRQVPPEAASVIALWVSGDLRF